MATPPPLRIVHVGLGPIGQQVVRIVAQRDDLASVAGLDVDPDLIGKRLSDLVPGAAEAPVHGEVGRLPAADVAVLATTSRLESLAPQVEGLVGAGLSVISTCEELTWPWDQPEAARRIDLAAAAAGKAVLGVGINPGYLMDLLPVVCTAVLERVEEVWVTRRVNIGRRRAQLQEKNGVGRPLEEARPLAESGALGHVGLETSARLIAAALGWEPLRIQQVNTPLTHPEPLPSAFGSVAPGRTVGIRQQLTAAQGERVRIRMDLVMTLEDIQELDEIRLETGAAGEGLLIRTAGVRGDGATAAIVANGIRIVHAARPGLRTVLDVPPIHV